MHVRRCGASPDNNKSGWPPRPRLMPDAEQE